MKKKIIILLWITIGLIFLLLISYVIISNNRKKQIMIIKNSYSQNVIVKRKTFLYDKKAKNEYKKIGVVAKGEVISLAKLNSVNNDYFKVINGDYYINYADVEPFKESSIKYPYINSNIMVVTKDKFKLYDGKDTIYEFNKKLKINVIYKNDNEYKVVYNNHLLTLNKDDTIKEEQLDIKYEDHNIIILYYENISDNCSSDNCVSTDFFKENMNKVKENNLISISLDDYRLWKENKVNLKDNVILIVVNNLTDEISSLTTNKLNNDDGFYDFEDNNNMSYKEEKKPSVYKIEKITTKEIFDEILKGKTLVYKLKDIKEQGIAVLNYHFFYDPSIGEVCKEDICEEVSKFESHLKYFNDDNFKTITMSEFVDWMDGKIELPLKSVLITIDDGGKGTDTYLPTLLEKYDEKATLFLITVWWNKDGYKSPNLEIQSHGYDIHRIGDCGKERALCLSHDELVEDLSKSIPLVDNNLSIAYPFYQYNDTVIEAVKDVGFKVAFTGHFKKAYKTSDRYAINRYEIFNTDSLATIKKYVNQ